MNKRVSKLFSPRSNKEYHRTFFINNQQFKIDSVLLCVLCGEFLYPYIYFEDVPLSRILTIEKRVKQMAPKPANTRAGIK